MPPASSFAGTYPELHTWWTSAVSGPEARELALPDQEEIAMVDRARCGDHAAFGWLLARYRQRVIRLAAHVLRRADEAEDAAQEAFVLAFRNIGSYRGNARFYTWLYTIVVRVCLERKRSARWRTDEPASITTELTSHDANAIDLMLIESLLDQLTPPMRAALVLRELEGLEYEEIAQVLRIPVGTVRSRLNTARSQFRTLWRAAHEEASHV